MSIAPASTAVIIRLLEKHVLGLHALNPSDAETKFHISDGRMAGRRLAPQGGLPAQLGLSSLQALCYNLHLVHDAVPLPAAVTSSCVQGECSGGDSGQRDKEAGGRVGRLAHHRHRPQRQAQAHPHPPGGLPILRPHLHRARRPLHQSGARRRQVSTPPTLRPPASSWFVAFGTPAVTMVLPGCCSNMRQDKERLMISRDKLVPW